MSPINFSAATLKAVCVRLSTLGAHRSASPLLHHVLIERGEGRVVLAVTDLSTALIYCALPAPLPVTEFQRKLSAMKWRAEALRFLAPLADLREAARTSRGAVSITPGEIHCGPLCVSRHAAPDVNDYPRILPPLDRIPEGWTQRELHPGRVDVMALAAED